MNKECTLGKDEKERLVHCLAKNLRTLRTICGWSQEKLASVIGVTRQTVLAVENGKRTMTWTMFLAFSFLFLGNEKTRKEFIDSGAYTEELAEFLNISYSRK
ncbi:MAG: helix-turn-helix domain-containing protein [Clostridia bacterium]|nr:helix-turn-helix domain-containing protein [Clostridia bacterium]